MIRLVETDKMELIQTLDAKFFEGSELKICDKTRAWVLCDGSDIIGFCTMKDIGYETAYLSRVAVFPEYRGKGLHTKMIKRRLKEARLSGFKWIVTYTMPDNIPSWMNLQNNGFKLYHPAYEWAGKTMFYWKKKL